MNTYPLYDVPWLVRDPNEYKMSAARHELELRNQSVVDDYFIARSKGLSATDAKKHVAQKHNLTTQRVVRIIRWFYEEAKKRRKYDFCVRYSLVFEQITD